MAFRRSVLHGLALLGCTALCSAQEPSLALLAADDECAAGDGLCALNALQLRGDRLQQEPEASANVSVVPPVHLDVPEDLNASLGANPNYLRHACNGPDYCVVGGYMIVPGHAVRGMESINGGNAGSFDHYMSAARDHCGDTGCVLITNPVGFRTQNQLHIHFRHYNGGGAAVKRRLESTLCGTHGWKSFAECGIGKAAIFSGFPGVFSAVAGAFGGGSLSYVGITVWETTACGGGVQTMVLASTSCSIEHSISAR